MALLSGEIGASVAAEVDSLARQARALRNTPADQVQLPRLAPLYVRCSHCGFLADRALAECGACGLIFAKLVKRRFPSRIEESPLWATAVTWLVELLLWRPRLFLSISALVVFLWWAAPNSALDGSHAPMAERSEGTWKETPDFRFRVTYLNPEGFVLAKCSPSRLLCGEYPVYHAGDKVDYEVEVANLRTSELTDFRVVASHEAFNIYGGPGRPLDSRRTLEGPAVLPVAGRIILRGRLTVAGPDRAGIVFEQTRLLFFSRQSEGMTLLWDSPQAGVIDPPSPRRSGTDASGDPSGEGAGPSKT